MAQSSVTPPSPMAGKDTPVDWMFAFKFNAQSFPGCTDDGTTPVVGSKGIFGGTVDAYTNGHSQQYVFATSASPTLVKGAGCLGATLEDPLGATFAQIYNTPGYYFVLWNDQFYNNPIENMDTPWGHSKGMVAWDDDGNGMVLQVSTPSWPASGSAAHPRQNDGNTLGCIHDDDIEVSQHFFSLKLTKADLVVVLQALANASVATNLSQQSIVNNGGPDDIQALVDDLGKLSASKQVIVATLSSGVKVISKPSALAVPPWQMISAKLGGVDLRVASWWAAPAIYSTDEGQTPTCWAPGLGTPGVVDIATSGEWNGTGIGLEGGDGPMFNHAKIGISTNAKTPLCIFGDMNQQGALAPNYAHPNQPCSSSQNGRGGTFYVVSDAALWTSLTALLKGASAPIKANDGSTVGGSGANAPTVRSPKASGSKKTSAKANGAKKTSSKTPKRTTAKKASAAKRKAPAREKRRASARESARKVVKKVVKRSQR
jgi:hypothetical protein